MITRKNVIKSSFAAAALATLLLLLPTVSPAKVDVYFNSQERLEKHLKGAFSHAVQRAKQGKQGTIDIMIFSFTTTHLADSMMRIARDFPNVRIRIIANLSQLFREPSSVLPDIENIASGKKENYRKAAERRKGFIEDEKIKEKAIEGELKYLTSEFRQKPLPNVEVKYKWFPSFSWIDDEGKITPYDKEGSCGYDHFNQKSTLLHHKMAVVNGVILVNGSYNWSQSAETKNFENIMIITGPEEHDLKMVTDFQAEFNALWNNPQLTMSSDECKRLKDEICEAVLLEREQALKEKKQEPVL